MFINSVENSGQASKSRRLTQTVTKTKTVRGTGTHIVFVLARDL